MTTLSHPYLNEKVAPTELPPDQEKLVDEIFQWIKEQPKFPNFSRYHAHQFLHACLWNVKSTKKALVKYCQIRSNAPEIFDNRDPMSLQQQNLLNIAHMAAMPHKTPEGYNILVYRLADTDPSKLQFTEAVKGFCMYNDYRISADGISEGYVVVFDMKGVRLGHLTRVQLGALRVFMNYIQEAHPVRLKKVYIVHTAAFINQIMALVKPLIKSDMFALLKFTAQGPLDFIAKELLPSDYGGDLDTIESFYAKERVALETEYREWLIDSAKLKEIDCSGEDGSSNNCINNSSCSDGVNNNSKTTMKNNKFDGKPNDTIVHSFSALEID